MRLAAFLAAALALAPAAARAQVAPADHAARGLYVRFERAGFHGGAYLNPDRSYVILQTGPDGVTVAFTGHWTPQGASGFCIAPDGGSPGKCFASMPQCVGRVERRMSDRGESYRLTLARGR